MPRVLITTSPYGHADPRPLELLKADGIDFVINPLGHRLTEGDLAGLIPGFDAMIAGTEPITARVMAGADRLRLIARVGIGLDSLDLPAARRHGIQVSYTPDAPAPAVAELTIGLMIALLRDLVGADRRMRGGRWARTLGRRLSESTIGVIGVGRVGRRVIAHVARGFEGVRILANDLEPDLAFGDAYGVVWAEKDVIYSQSDLITLHVPLTPQTRSLVTAREIGVMKPGVLLINTARGGIICEMDLEAALRSGRVAGAALDVFDKEPYAGPLASLDNCIVTSHMGSMAHDCRVRMEIEAAEEVIRFFRGEPLHGAVPESEYALSGTAAR